MNIPYFGIGMILGYFGFDYIKKKYLLVSPSKEHKKLHEEVETNTGYIEYDDKGEFDGGTSYPKHKDIRRKRSDNTWATTYREYVSDLLQGIEYVSKEAASNDVEGDLLLVNEDSDTIDIKKKVNADEHIISINAVEFVKAIANSREMLGFTFNPFDKEFRTYSSDIIAKDLMVDIVGKNNIQEILNESKINANGWIQTRYYYDSLNDIYLKIETA